MLVWDALLHAADSGEGGEAIVYAWLRVSFDYHYPPPGSECSQVAGWLLRVYALGSTLALLAGPFMPGVVLLCFMFPEAARIGLRKKVGVFLASLVLSGIMVVMLKLAVPWVA